ncbi:MAG: thiol protease/hemagglutinin PrtT [Bacteroidetes bacterium]|nr:thiol protease/hemagglutinin PrtT [Bacteroidota bacterium]
MKKIAYSSLAFALFVGTATARPIAPLAAKTIAENFYKKNAVVPIISSSLAYTYTDATGQPVYYAYNINNHDGFVIISAEDAGKPIIGYSTKNSFVTPKPHSQIEYWMGLRVKEIQSIREHNLVATPEVTAEWNKYTSNNNQRMTGGAGTVMSGTVAPLVQTQWNQSPYYNDSCPGGSVTGCVATTMSQIMRYWQWPVKGTGSSSYCDCTSSGYSQNYGTLSANYGATTYNWGNMPLVVNAPNSDVAQLCYQAGVSVDMDYSPSGSGALVLQVDAGPGGPCAQYSYINYFGYDPSIIAGYVRTTVSNDSLWMQYIKTDLNLGRPVQYAGADPSEGGHTWVCDGYDANNYVHMNWGWGGYDDGFFSINNLQTTNGTFNPSTQHEILTGIVPMHTYSLDASIAAITSPSGAYCPGSSNITPSVVLLNAGTTAMTSCNINYQVDAGTLQTMNWTGNLAGSQSVTVSLPSYASAAGSHTLVCYSSNPNGGTDQNPSNDTSKTMYSASVAGSLPVSEGFENPSTYTNWDVYNTGGTSGQNWGVTTAAAADGSHSILLNNLGNTSGVASTIQSISVYNLTTLSSPELTYKAAYQQTNTSNNDGLQVFASTDCGATWSAKQYLSSTTLASLSGSPSSSAYVPSPSQFTTYTVPIASVASSTQVMFKWVFTAGSSVGNNIYIDDINLFDAAATTGLSKIENEMNLNVYPNPSSGVVNIAFNLSDKQNISVNVMDVLGRVVETIPAQQYAAGNNTLTIGQQTYQAGVYFVNISVNGQLISKKIVMQ